MCDENLLDSLGLSYATLGSSQGKLAAEKMTTIVSHLSPTSSIDGDTRAGMARGFEVWSNGTEDGLRSKVLQEHKDAIYELICSLAIVEDAAEGSTYQGAVFVAASLAKTMHMAGIRDATQALALQFAPLAYAAADKILEFEANLTFAVVTPFNATETAATFRTDTCCSLVSTLPYQGKLTLAIGMKVLAKILRGSYPARLQQIAKSSISTLTNIAKDSVAHSGAELLDIAQRDNPDLLMTFVSMQELYIHSEEAVHSHLDLFLKQPYMMYCSLFFRISQVHPDILTPHFQFFLAQLTQTPAVGSVTLLVIEAIAGRQPDAVYAHLDTILPACTSLANSSTSLAKLLGVLGSNASHPEAASKTLQHLVRLLDADTTARPSCFAAICNVMKALPSVDLLQPHMEAIAKHRTVSEQSYTAIVDFVAGRSLESLSARVDEVEARITALNSKVSQTCHNLADVIAYVDANMADMKDFLADVAKKLPQPKRLEVIGKFRKTLVLHFVCCHTGLEYPITSTEWSKWLKMGFSLVKAGQAVIDLGLGNPLGILTKGVECIQEIYTAYRTEDEDEFNTYITNPFLTSAEQDQLLEKLRDQRFFEVFAYDAQRAGWYLLHPQRDGHQPEGEAGSVTKVRTKEGYGLGDQWRDVAKEMAATVVGKDVVEMVSMQNPLFPSTVTEEEEEESKQGSRAAGKPASPSPSPSPSPTPRGGGRAAAMREQLGTGAMAEAASRLEGSERQAGYYARVEGLEKQVQALESQLRVLSKEVDQLKARRTGCACIIS